MTQPTRKTPPPVARTAPPEPAPPRRRATLRDVAERAGVSPTTASLVLNGKPISVPEETRGRVVSAAAHLHYVPNALVRSLQAGRTGTLGCHIQFGASVWQNAFVGALVDGLRRGAAAAGWDVLLYRPPEQGTVGIGAAPILDGRVDAAVLWVADDTALSGVARAGFPAVVLMHDAVPAPLGAVVIDERLGSRLVLDHLLALGHRTVAYVATAGRTPLAPHLRARQDAFLAAAAAAGVPLPPERVVAGSPEAAAGAPAGQLRALLARAEGRPTAVVCAFEELAYRTIALAGQLGLRVPEDLSVVAEELVGTPDSAGDAPDALPAAGTGSAPGELPPGSTFGGEPPAARRGAWLTGTRVPIWEMGRAAAEAAADMLRHPARRGPRLIFPAELHLGSTTAPARG